MSEYYTASGSPSTGSSGSSSTQRAEFTAIETGLALLPTLSGNASKIVAINATGTAMESITSLSVAQGGTGATTLIDGGILLGSGTGAITALAVLADGEMIVGDGTTDPAIESGATLRTSIGVGTTDSLTLTGLTVTGTVDIDGGAIDGTPIGATTTSTGAFSSLTVGGSAIGDPGLVLLETVVASSASTIDIGESFLDIGTYDEFEIRVTEFNPSIDGADLLIRLKYAGSFLAVNYSYHSAVGIYSSNSYSALVSQTDTSIQISNQIGNADAISLTLSIANPASSIKRMVYWKGANVFNITNGKALSGSGINHATTIIQGVRFLMSTGTFSGTARLYGVIK